LIIQLLSVLSALNKLIR